MPGDPKNIDKQVDPKDLVPAALVAAKEKDLKDAKIGVVSEVEIKLKKQDVHDVQNEKRLALREKVNAEKPDLAQYEHQVKYNDTVGAVALGAIQGFRKLDAAKYGNLKIDWASKVEYHNGKNLVKEVTLAQANYLFPGDTIKFRVEGDAVVVIINAGEKTLGYLKKGNKKVEKKDGKMKLKDDPNMKLQGDKAPTKDDGKMPLEDDGKTNLKNDKAPPVNDDGKMKLKDDDQNKLGGDGKMPSKDDGKMKLDKDPSGKMD